MKNQLLSDININFLIEKILENFKISQKAVEKCRTIIVKNLTQDLSNLNRFPENTDEMIEAINFLTKKSFDDFVTYLN